MHPKPSRILTFDLLRGYFLLAIILNHLYYYPNGLDWVAMRGDLFVSAAEGFFFISGIVLGIVRGRKLIEQPLRRVAKLLWRRSLQLYVTSVALIFIFTLLGWWFFLGDAGLKYGIHPHNDVWGFLWRTLSLQHFYGWADYLRLYAIFLFFTPLAMWLLRAGKWWVLMLASVGVWLLYPDSLNLFSPYDQKQLFQPLSWQLIFFAGLTVGFHWQQITEWWRTRSSSLRRGVVIGVVSLATVTLVLNIVAVFGVRMGLPGDFAQPLRELGSQWHFEYFDKERLDVARITMFGLWFGAAFWAFQRFERLIVRWLGWLLLPYGTNSLYVYTLHAFAIFLVHIYVPKGGWLMNFVTAMSVILLIRLAIHYRLLMNIIPR